jgi:hypothetical protein
LQHHRGQSITATAPRAPRRLNALVDEKGEPTRVKVVGKKHFYFILISPDLNARSAARQRPASGAPIAQFAVVGVPFSTPRPLAFDKIVD